MTGHREAIIERADSSRVAGGGLGFVTQGMSVIADKGELAMADALKNSKTR